MFDTNKRCDSFEIFIKEPMKIGTIVLAACKDDIFENLSEKSK